MNSRDSRPPLEFHQVTQRAALSTSISPLLSTSQKRFWQVESCAGSTDLWIRSEIIGSHSSKVITGNVGKLSIIARMRDVRSDGCIPPCSESGVVDARQALSWRSSSIVDWSIGCASAIAEGGAVTRITDLIARRN